MRKFFLFSIIMALFLFVACSPKAPKGPNPPEPPKPPQREELQAYYDFDDIPVPKEMKLVPKKSILFESAALKAGVVTFEGMVDPVSLFDYYVNSMPQENWSLRSYFKYGQYILVFEKPDKDCIIHIKDKPFNTEMQIWVTPRLKVGESAEPLSPSEELKTKVK
ncbi:hypothetical protein [Desulfonauticus submarinus]